MFTNPDAIARWQRLEERLDRRDQMRLWAAAEPVLARVASVAALPRLVLGEPNPELRDELLAALVRLAARDGGDDCDAVLVVLHLLLPGASRLAASLSHLCDAASCDQPLDLVLGELTLLIRSYPWQRRPTRMAANLLLGAKKSLLRGELRDVARARRSEGRDHDMAAPATDPRWVADHSGGPAAELLDLMMWAHRSGVADADDLALLVELAQAQASGPGARLRVAEQRQINERTLRRRRDLTLSRLQRAAGDYLRACA